MKEHFCPVEQSTITYQDKCNWCGELESQEPVVHQNWCASLTQLLLSMPPQPAPCNCHPPQRTWVGLTDDEVELYWDWEDFQTGAGRSTIFAMVRDIESRLKERNT